MFRPNHSKEERSDLIYELIQDVSFATVLTDGQTNLISHLPVKMRMGPSGQPELLTHCARANPHWKDLKQIGRATFIFNGPHGYISPAWYPPAIDNVPTWNYAVVHVKGRVEIIEDPLSTSESMSEFVAHFESVYKTGWVLPQNVAAIESLMKGIVVFKLKDLEFEEKFKLSQKQDPEIRDNVILNLKKQPKNLNLAEYMKKSKSN